MNISLVHLCRVCDAMVYREMSFSQLHARHGGGERTDELVPLPRCELHRLLNSVRALELGMENAIGLDRRFRLTDNGSWRMLEDRLPEEQPEHVLR